MKIRWTSAIQCVTLHNGERYRTTGCLFFFGRVTTIASPFGVSMTRNVGVFIWEGARSMFFQEDGLGRRGVTRASGS